MRVLKSGTTSNSGCLRGLLIAGLLGIIAGWGVNEMLVGVLRDRVDTYAPVEVAPRPETPPRPPATIAPGIISSVDDAPDDGAADRPAGIAPAAPEPRAAQKNASKNASADAKRPDRAPKTAKKAKATQKSPAAPAKPTAQSPPPGGHSRSFTIDRAALRRQFRKPSDLFGHGRYLPNIEGDTRRGLRFVDLSPGGIFSQLGFKNGDVVISVNGVPLNTQQDVLANFEKMRKMHILNLVLERNGTPIHHRYILK